MQGHKVTSGMTAPTVRKRVTPMGKKLARKVNGKRWKGSTLAALQYLALHADDDTGIVRGIGLMKLAEDLGLSWQRIKVIMQSLRNGGTVETLHRGGGKQTNVYRLHI